MRKIIDSQKLILIASIASLLSINAAQAASSKWEDLYGADARLSAVKDPQTDIITGFVEIKLKEGWTTYWKHPGDAGIPPIFDFSQSKNFTLENIEYPVPKLIKYEGGSYLGYKNTVRFLFSGKATQADASLNLNLLAGVCEEICIPAEALFKIEGRALNQSDPRTATSLMLAKSYLPKDIQEDFMLHDIELEEQSVSATLTLPENLKEPIMLIEGPNNWFSGVIKVSDDKVSYRFPDALTKQANWKSKITYTLIANGQAVTGDFDK